MKGVLTALAGAIVVAHATCFVLCLTDSHRIGGMAINGSQADGRYWVADHGRRTEVSAGDYRRSWWLGMGVFAGAPFNMAAAGFLMFTQVLPRFLYRRGEGALEAAERRVRGSGPAVAEARVGGSIGRMNFGGPMLNIAVHPGGFRVKPIWMAPFAIERDQVIAVVERKVAFQKFVEIEHRSPDLRSPIRVEARIPKLTAALVALAPPSRRG